jgi:hypothetical protein
VKSKNLEIYDEFTVKGRKGYSITLFESRDAVLRKA